MSSDTFGLVGSSIRTASGKYLDLLNPDPASIDIESIAAALSKICRFGGHCPQFYSVAEHCVLASRLALRDTNLSLAGVRAVFLHDAAEAYLGDVVKPLKVHLDRFLMIEIAMNRAVEERFNVSFFTYRQTIKAIDRALLKQEKLTMWPRDLHHWQGFDEIEAADIEIDFQTHERARIDFLHTAEELELLR